ncbi:hypothetical protein HZS_3004 [Henneguya salminicola]|nr:hypothetical protein HZS_3004 [Henneguya salminicola]
MPIRPAHVLMILAFNSLNIVDSEVILRGGLKLQFKAFTKDIYLSGTTFIFPIRNKKIFQEGFLCEIRYLIKYIPFLNPYDVSGRMDYFKDQTIFFRKYKILIFQFSQTISQMTFYVANHCFVYQLRIIFLPLAFYFSKPGNAMPTLSGLTKLDVKFILQKVVDTYSKLQSNIRKMHGNFHPRFFI